MSVVENQQSLRLAECFLSLQGEGPSLGAPAHFVRLQGCSVGCRWCDSKYTWNSAEGQESSLDELQARLSALGNSRLLVVTGGEPLESASFLPVIEWAEPHWPRIEVETSGIVRPPEVPKNVWWNWSPKLSLATPQADATWEHASAFLESGQFICKVVVSEESDWSELLERVTKYSVPSESVWVMPEGMTVKALEDRAKWLAPHCIDAGFRLTMRLHVHLWGARRGV